MVKGWIALIAMFVTFGLGYAAGRDSVKQIDKVCPQQKAKLITSSHSNNETICVYQEPWSAKGRLKRIEL